MSKYDWSNIHEDVKYIATDPDDFELWFSDEPRLASKFGWIGDAIAIHSPSSFKGDWRDSLEKRPNQ